MKQKFTICIALLLCLALALGLTACGADDREASAQLFALGALIDLKAYGRDGEKAVADAGAALTSISDLTDPENERGSVYQINHADGAPVAVNAQIAAMIQTAQTVSANTDGALDLTVYPLLEAWGVLDENYRVPEDAELAALLAHVGMDKLSLAPDQENGGYLAAAAAGTRITLACVARGAASNAAINAMRADGVKSGLVSMSGSVQTLGTKPDGSRWNIAVMDPNNAGAYIGYLSVGETAVVTSASTDRSFTQRGALYHHILNPANGEPANSGLKSVTIVCADAQLADCLSTALFVRGERAALQYWRDYGGFEMLLITNDGRAVLTDGLYGVFTQSGGDYTVSYVK